MSTRWTTSPRLTASTRSAFGPITISAIRTTSTPSTSRRTRCRNRPSGSRVRRNAPCWSLLLIHGVVASTPRSGIWRMRRKSGGREHEGAWALGESPDRISRCAGAGGFVDDAGHQTDVQYRSEEPDMTGSRPAFLPAAAAAAVALALAGCAGGNMPSFGSLGGSEPPSAPAPTPTVRPDDLVGRWGLASFQKPE